MVKHSTPCPWAKNGCILKSDNSPHTGLLILVILIADNQGGDLLACEMIFPHSQFWLSYYILKINYIYPDSYGEKIQFIAIPIGAKYQQVNMTPGSIWSHALLLGSEK